jgi:hypothetical protein
MSLYSMRTGSRPRGEIPQVKAYRFCKHLYYAVSAIPLSTLCSKLRWGQITQSLLNPLAIVVYFHIFERSLLHVRDILPCMQVDELFIERRVP